MTTLTMEAENNQLKAEVAKLRAQLMKEQQRSAELDEECLRLRMLYSTSTTSLPVGDFVEVDDGYFLCTSATSVSDAEPVETIQCRDVISIEDITPNTASPVVPTNNEDDDDDTQSHSGPTTSAVEAPLLHQIATRRGPVHITSWRGTRVISEAFAGNVSQLCSLGTGLACLLDSWDQWICVPLKGSTEKFAFRSSHGLFLCAERNGTVVADRRELRDWEKWTAVAMDGGYAFRSSHGTYLCAEPDGRIVCNRNIADKWEIFVVSPV